MTRILGIDPGSQRTGIGLIDVDAGGKCAFVHCQMLNLLVDTDDFPARLGKLVFDLEEVLETWQPTVVAIETVFMDKSAMSALKLGHARGAAIATVVRRGLSVSEYAPRVIKQSLVGSGAADKTQVQHMVKLLLSLGERKLQADAADALAVALTHAHTSATAGRSGLDPALLLRRRRR
ncbi:MAG: crossover junction endodeoxyribonuclease RuvC [Arenimonas sp.]|nr:crossover junction endodeoxyribonuclease RuvC [Arenimonas sp.]